MKKFFTKIKTILATLGIALISFSSKVIGQSEWSAEPGFSFGDAQRIESISVQATYGVPNPISPVNPILNAIKWTLTVTILIIGIVNLIKIIRTDDKDLKKKRIKNTIIIISMLIILIIISLLLPRFLKKYL